MTSFLCGTLDMILMKNSADNPPTFFSTIEEQTDFRRFLLNILRLSGVIPVRMRIVTRSEYENYFKCSVNPGDLARIGVNFLKGKITPNSIQETKTISYSSIRYISSRQGRVVYLTTNEPHWSPIVDLLPLHRHEF